MADLNSAIAIIIPAAATLAAGVMASPLLLNGVLRIFAKGRARWTFLYDLALRLSVLRVLRLLESRGEWEAVVDVGVPMSAYFWNHGHYQSLISVASLIEKSAYELELPDLQAQIRIEHMGGVAARLGREREALESIRTGIAIAKQTGNKFLEVKGLRHLAGIAFKAGDLDGAQAKLEKALEQSEVITEGKHQAEAAAPVHYGFAELLMARGKMTEARSHHDQATQLYALIDDKRRSLKLIPQRATLLEHDGDIDGARALFEEGCRKARALGRVDDVLTSLKGVFRTTALEGQKAKLDREIKIIGRAIGHD